MRFITVGSYVLSYLSDDRIDILDAESGEVLQMNCSEHEAFLFLIGR